MLREAAFSSTNNNCCFVCFVNQSNRFGNTTCLRFFPCRDGKQRGRGKWQTLVASPKSCITAQWRREKLVPHLLLSTVTLGESLPVKPQQKHNRIASTVQTFTGGQANNKLGYYIRAEIDCWWGGKRKAFLYRRNTCCCCGTTGFLLIVLMMLCSFCRRNAAIPSSAGGGIQLRRWHIIISPSSSK